MGKKLIIKGADFSAVAVDIDSSGSVLAAITQAGFAVGNSWTSQGGKKLPERTTDNNKRASCSDFVDISDITEEVTSITLTPKQGYAFCAYLGNGQEGQTSITTWTWNTEAVTYNVDSSVTTIVVMCKAQDDSVLSSNDIKDYLTESRT